MAKGNYMTCIIFILGIIEMMGREGHRFLTDIVSLRDDIKISDQFAIFTRLTIGSPPLFLVAIFSLNLSVMNLRPVPLNF